MFEAGGVAAVAAPLRDAGFLTDTPTVTGNSLFAELDQAPSATANHPLVHPVENPLRPHGGFAVLYGNLAPEEIGRASCRERGESSERAVAVKDKTKRGGKRGSERKNMSTRQ